MYNWIASLVTHHMTFLFFLLFFGVSFANISKTKKQTKYAKKVLQKAIDSGTNEPLTMHPEINPNLCAGCGACTLVCPEGEILKLINHKAVLIKPTKCVGHGECEVVCPTNAISLVFGTKTRGMDIPRISGDYETNVSGLYIAGELGGMGLIRNAMKQGYLAAKHALANIKSGGQADVDVLIVGAGPAGLTAGLTAIAEKKTYMLVEQGGFGGAVFNFPRQKIVMTHPVELPLAGTMKFPKHKVSKEELLAYWNGVRKDTGLKVTENTKFENLEKVGDIFQVKLSTGVVKARKVMLCMGVRGSPRKLGLKNEDMAKVTYNLLDPEQYQQQHVVVVGGGNAGVEAAQYLAKPQYRNKVTLLVRGPTFDRCNEENKDIVNKMESEGLLEIWYESSIKAIEKDHLLITTKNGEKQIPNQFLFIFAGAEMPHKFLMGLGIQIDKKFGEALKKTG